MKKTVPIIPLSSFEKNPNSFHVKRESFVILISFDA